MWAVGASKIRVVAGAVLVLAFAVLMAQPAHAAPVTITDAAGISYEVDDEDPDAGATVTDYDPAVGGTVVHIPETVTINGDSYSVTTIGLLAFSDKGLIEVTIPDSVTTIGNSAFTRNFLTEVKIPDSVTSLGDSAFRDNFLTEVTIPDSVTTVSATAFAYNFLTKVTIPDSVTSIGPGAFRDNFLTEVTIPGSVEDIHENAFSGNALTNVTIPNSVRWIGNFGFFGNDLTELTIPESVLAIGYWAFGSNQLTQVTIPSSVKVIDFGAFESNALTEVTIPDSVTKIGSKAFADNSLTEVTIPNSVTTIEDSAFAGNGSLSTVWFEGDAPTITAAGEKGSFGHAEGKTLHVYSSAAGFSVPTWHGYHVAALSAVTFDPNGGDGEMSVQTSYEAAALTPNSFTREGHNFAGWNTSGDGTGTPYEDRAIYDFMADVTMYALWEAVTVPGDAEPAAPHVAEQPDRVAADPAPAAVSNDVVAGELAATGPSSNAALLLAALLAIASGSRLVLLGRRSPTGA